MSSWKAGIAADMRRRGTLLLPCVHAAWKGVSDQMFSLTRHSLAPGLLAGGVSTSPEYPPAPVTGAAAHLPSSTTTTSNLPL